MSLSDGQAVLLAYLNRKNVRSRIGAASSSKTGGRTDTIGTMQGGENAPPRRSRLSSPFADFTMTNQTKFATNLALVLSMTLASACLGQAAQRNERRAAPDHIPPRRSSQIQNGPGGVNTSLPREPYVPWNRWWWTRMFDGGFKWVRI